MITMPQQSNERSTLPVVNKEAAEILEAFLHRRLEVIRAKSTRHESIKEESDEKHMRLKVTEKITSSLGDVLDIDGGDLDVFRDNNLDDSNCDKRPHSLPSDFRNKVKSNEDIKVLLNSIKKDKSFSKQGTKKGNFSGSKSGNNKDIKVDSPSDSSDNYPDEDWLRHKPRKKKNFFKRTKERLQHAFKLQQSNKKNKKDELLYTDIGVLSVSEIDRREKRSKRKKSRRCKDVKDSDFDGYSSATRSESATPGKSDVLVDRHECGLKRVQSDEVFKHRRIDITRTLPTSFQDDPPSSRVVGHFKDKILNPLRRSFSRSKSKGSESGNNTDTTTRSDHKDAISRRPKPDIPRPPLPGDENYKSPQISDTDSKNAVKVFKEILSLDLNDGISPKVESPPYVNFQYTTNPEPIYADIENAQSHTSFEDIDDTDDPVWVPRIEPDQVGGARRDDLFLPRLKETQMTTSASMTVRHTEYSYKVMTYEEKRQNSLEEAAKDMTAKGGLYGIIAHKLSSIADTCVARIDSESLSDSDSSKNQEKTATSTKDSQGLERLSSLEKQIITCLRQNGDKIAQNHDFPSNTATHLIQQVGYGAFKKTMQNTIGSEPGWNQVAMLFYVANSAVRLAGASGALASKVKENTLRYFEDKFAEWIVGQGGWDSMLEDTSTPDTELD